MSAPYRDTVEPMRERARALVRTRDQLRAEVATTEARLARVKDALMSVMTPPDEGSGWRWLLLVVGALVGAVVTVGG